MKKPKVLLYGFSGFGRIRENPSALVVRRLRELGPAGIRLKTAVLRVSYRDAAARLRKLLEDDYDLALGFGTAAGSAAFRLEAAARVRVSPALADEDGRKKHSSFAVPGGPALFRSGLPLARIKRAFDSARLPVQLSEDAGGYLCNFAYYLVSFRTSKTGSRTRCGFLHVPLHREYACRAGFEGPSLPLSKIHAAARLFFSESLRSLS